MAIVIGVVRAQVVLDNDESSTPLFLGAQSSAPSETNKNDWEDFLEDSEDEGTVTGWPRLVVTTVPHLWRFNCKTGVLANIETKLILGVAGIQDSSAHWPKGEPVVLVPDSRMLAGDSDEHSETSEEEDNTGSCDERPPFAKLVSSRASHDSERNVAVVGTPLTICQMPRLGGGFGNVVVNGPGKRELVLDVDYARSSASDGTGVILWRAKGTILNPSLQRNTANQRFVFEARPLVNAAWWDPRTIDPPADWSLPAFTVTVPPHHGLIPENPASSQNPAKFFAVGLHSVREPLKQTTLRVVAISDMHMRHRSLGNARDGRGSGKYGASLTQPHFPRADVLIVAGDFTNWRSSAIDIIEFNEWLGEIKSGFEHIIVVAGNHDLCLNSRFGYSASTADIHSMLSNCTAYLCDEEVVLYGGAVKIYGSPWHKRRWTKAAEAFAVARNATLQAYWKRIPADTDIFISHVPPADVMDNWGNGCSLLRDELEKRVRPSVHIFGHCHDTPGICRLGVLDSQQHVAYACNVSQGWHGSRPVVFDVNLAPMNN